MTKPRSRGSGADTTRVHDHRRTWQSKPALRALYADFFDRIRARMLSGPTLEIGSGSGNFGQSDSDVVSLDIQQTPWLDVVADAHRLPFRDQTFANIVLVDTLHHLERPLLFLEEASRVLRSRGRLILLEPGITPWSRLLFQAFHEEPVRMDADVLRRDPPVGTRDPYDANQAIATLLFERQRGRLEAEMPALRVSELRRLSLFAYPLSGGFRSWCLLPRAAVRPVLALEEALMPWLGRWMAMRLLVVVERT